MGDTREILRRTTDVLDELSRSLERIARGQEALHGEILHLHSMLEGVATGVAQTNRRMTFLENWLSANSPASEQQLERLKQAVEQTNERNEERFEELQKELTALQESKPCLAG